ncbi:MAG: PKD domain protein [Methanoregula sp. PtaU1.Bin051]|nr:MAG: PKD domain protein [Methanoregula sp. PtaU1.Bin051]
MSLFCTPTSGYAPLTVKFTDLSTNSPTSWSWDFGDGDGTNATQQNPVHTYTSAGMYTVKLTATNGDGSDGEEKEDYITVETPTYSMTSVTLYTNASYYPSLPNGQAMHDTIQNWLTGTPGWSESFYQENTEVEDTDFGTQNSGYQGLDETVLHYHYGHGGIGENGETYLPYTYWPSGNLTRDEVYKKWDLTNKWVVFDACNVLSNLQWGGALKYSHGILGFYTEKTPSVDLPDRFLQNCIDNDYTIAYAWRDATEKTYYGSGIVARVIFDTDEQLNNDHLAGQGMIAADEYPDDDTVYWSEWTC